jgi:hypothetical protein
MNEIYIGDSYPITVSWFVPSPDNPYQSADAEIEGAEVTVIRNRDRAVVVDSQTATISGNETVYVLPAALNTRSGLHTAYVTSTFADETVLTKAIEFYVKTK